MTDKLDYNDPSVYNAMGASDAFYPQSEHPMFFDQDNASLCNSVDIQPPAADHDVPWFSSGFALNTDVYGDARAGSFEVSRDYAPASTPAPMPRNFADCPSLMPAPMPPAMAPPIPAFMPAPMSVPLPSAPCHGCCGDLFQAGAYPKKGRRTDSSRKKTITWNDEWRYAFSIVILTVGVGNAKTSEILVKLRAMLPDCPIGKHQVESYWQSLRRKIRKDYQLPKEVIPGNEHIPKDIDQSLCPLARRWVPTFGM